MGVKLVGLCILVLGALVAAPAGAADAPTLAMPATAATGDVIEVTVTACAVAPTGGWFATGDSSNPVPLAFAAGSVADSWTASFVAPDFDVVVHGDCAGTFLSGLTDVATTTTPTVTTSPASPVPGDTITIVVAGCTGQPRGAFGWELDDVGFGLPFTEGPAGTWTATVTALARNLNGFVACVGWTGDQVHVDVEAPFLLFGPYAVPGGYRYPLESVSGTDCPAGTEPAISFDGGGQHWDATAPIDEEGGWEVELPDFSSLPEGTTVTVSAVCGAVTYEPIQSVFGEGGDTTSTTAGSTTVAAVSGGTGAAPAVPVAGAAAYTG